MALFVKVGVNLKPQIYKVGTDWIVWVPGVKIYRFARWDEALSFVLAPAARQQQVMALARAAANAS